MEAAVEITRSVTRLVDAARSAVDEWAAGEGFADPWAPEVAERLEAEYVAAPTEEKRTFLGYWIGEFLVRRRGHRWSLLERSGHPFLLEFMVVVVNADGSQGTPARNFLGLDPADHVRLQPGWLARQIGPEEEWLLLRKLVLANLDDLLPEPPAGVTLEIDRRLLSRSLGAWLPNQPVAANGWSTTPVDTWDELGEERTLDWARRVLHHTLEAAFKDLGVHETWRRGLGVDSGERLVTVTGLDSYRVTG